ncbi:hypothetical protein KFK09_029060 [Dendrobium nobile]|uniref:Reverse transcriptase Ty1/copia-type domain-containing protein n=1 Tax=Dendrobium nobile TaxID=94219 RepID=A0A8T3A473_DENNO|nr:hypothetical protein KFK09_029060 [Dendrobium nobile]
MTTIRMLLTLALHRNCSTLQLDVSNAFLHGDLTENIYMRQPPGFIDKHRPTHVCKLQKLLYGLKQAPRQWFQKLTDFLLQFGFRFSRSDPSILIFNKHQIQLYFLIYVDDILLTGNNSPMIQELHQLHSHFALKQLGPVSLFLVIQTIKTKTGFFLHQTHYAQQLLHTTGLAECSSAPTPITPTKANQLESNTPFSDPQLYRKLAGSLQYLSITRPDIAFIANRICQHMHAPTEHHFQMLKRLLPYIKGSLHYGLPITLGNLQLRCYTDAD